MTKDIGEPHDHDHSSDSEGGAVLSPEQLSIDSGGLTQITSDGAWTWFHAPRSVGDGAGTVYVGWVNSGGDIAIGAIDEASETVTETTTLSAALQADDHAVPALLYRNDGRLMAFYSKHSGANIYYRTSTNPDDISSFDTEQSISPNADNSHTYMNPRQRASDGRIFLFYRGLDDLDYVHSDDDGATWSAEAELVNTPTGEFRTYFRIGEMQSGRADIAVTRVPSSPNAGNAVDIRHCYFDGGSLFDISGTDLGALPIDNTNVPLVYDSAAAGNHNAWVWDCKTDADRPEIVFATFPAMDDHRYNYAIYDGGWAVTELCEAGQFITTGLYEQEYYSPGICLDHGDEGEIHLSKGGYEGAKLQQWSSSDGTTWRVSDVTGSEKQNVRPVCPWNSSLGSIWMQGQYSYFEYGGYETALVFGDPKGDGPTVAGGYRFGGTEASLSADGTLSSGAVATIPLDTVSNQLSRGQHPFDAREEFDAANNGITVTKTGLYLVEGGIGLKNLSAAARVEGFVKVNGNRVSKINSINADAGAYPQVNGGKTVRLIKGDTVTLAGYQNSGAGQTVAGDAAATYLQTIQIL